MKNTNLIKTMEQQKNIYNDKMKSISELSKRNIGAILFWKNINLWCSYNSIILILKVNAPIA